MKVRSLSGGGGVSVSLLLSLATLVYVVLLVETVEGKVRCYVCSWHSPAHGGQNMTDTCSHYKFDETYTHTIECQDGCEAVSIRKSKNENIVNFYKNCKSEESKSSSSKDTCTTMEDETFQYVTTCECSSDLCNAADNKRRHSSRGVLMASYLVLTLPYFIVGF